MAERTTSKVRFKAAILEKQNKPLVVDEIGIYLPGLGAGQVLVKVHCSSICGSQIGEITGAVGPDKYLPHLLGHEGGGVVEEIGAGVTTVKKGDHVVMHWRRGKGIEASPPSYQRGENDVVGAGPIATFSEYAIVSENRLTAIDNDIPFDIAALMGCAVTTGLGVVFKEADLKPGESIAVIGCGGVGLNVIQAAAMVSAYSIIAVDINNLKLQMAWTFGATHTINARDYLYSPNVKSLEGVLNSLAEQIKKLATIDVAVDCTGIASLMETAFTIVRPGGRMVLVGLPHGDQDSIIKFHNMRQHFTSKKIIFSEGGNTQPNTDIPRYLRLYKTGKLKLDELITDRYTLDEINMAIDTLRAGNCGRCVVEMP